MSPYRRSTISPHDIPPRRHPARRPHQGARPPGTAGDRAGADALRSRCCCGDIVRHLPLAQSTVSQHLKVLREAASSAARSRARAPAIASTRPRSKPSPSAMAGSRRAGARDMAGAAVMAAAAAQPAPAKDAKVRPETTFRTLRNLWPYMWPADRPGPEAARRAGARRPGRGQDRHRARALHLQVGDRRADAPPATGADGDVTVGARRRC